MIQEAHVGLGIMGKEGRAAVRSADFAFAKFKHLQKVLLVHGHWYVQMHFRFTEKEFGIHIFSNNFFIPLIAIIFSRYYVRVANLVQYFFYKNVAGFTSQILMAIFNNFSTQSIYDSINLTLFNIFWTSLPIFIYGMLEQNLPAATLMNHPKLYKNNAKNR